MPVAPTLVAAVFDGTLLTVTLTFDVAVDVGGFVPSQVNVIDGPNAQLFQAVSVTLEDPVTARVDLTQVDSASGDDVTLDATPANGIVAVGGGMAWAGVAGLVLPWP